MMTKHIFLSLFWQDFRSGVEWEILLVFPGQNIHDCHRFITRDDECVVYQRNNKIVSLFFVHALQQFYVSLFVLDVYVSLEFG